MNSAKTHINIATRLDDIAVLIGTQQNKEIELHTGDVVERPGLDLSTYSTVLEQTAQRWRHGITNIPVIGGMSAGKSTFLNGWLGTDLPTGPGAVTGIVLELTAEAFDGFRVFYADGTEKTMDAEAYRDFNVVEDGGSIVGGNAFRLPAHLQPVLYARLGRLRGLPEKGLVFVDTLGFNAGGAAAATTHGYLNNADIIIMVLSGQQLFTETDVEVLQHIAARDIEREDVEDASIFFVININVQAMDTEEAKELVRKQVKAKLEGLVPAEDIPHRVFLVDALTALNLTRAGESGAALEATGLPAFQRSLEAAIETGDLLQAKLERTMDTHVLPALNAAWQEIGLRRDTLQLDDEKREQAIAAAQGALDKVHAKKQAVLKAVDSLIEMVAARAETLFLSEFAEKMGDRAFWREKWAKEGIELWWSEKVTALVAYEARREALEWQIVPSLERIFQAELDAWVKALPNKLTDYLDAAKAQPLVEDLDRALDQLEAGLNRGDLHLKRIGDIDTVQSDANWKQAIYAAIGVALVKINDTGVNYTQGTGLIFLKSMLTDLSILSGKILTRRTILELLLYKSALSDSIAREAWIIFTLEGEGPKIASKIRRVMVKSFAVHREKLEEVLEGEVTGRETRLETLRHASDTGSEEETRLERIESALRSQWTVLSQRTYGQVLTAEEIRTRLGAEETPEPETTETETLIVPVPAGMMLIPAGEFQMGSNDAEATRDEQPVHTVHMDAFYMDTHEVTNAEYQIFVLENPKWQKGRIPDGLDFGSYLSHWEGNNYPVGKADHPVTYVPWYAAMAYAAWVGKRLPTEAEWEKAARGGEAGLKYPWGDTITPNDANYHRNVGDTRPVGSYAANGYGLYDMAGNVWEWCLDEWNWTFYSASPSRNPLSGVSGSMLANVDEIIDNYTSVTSLRVLRGGGWYDASRYLRVASRLGNTPTLSSADLLGFRCARAVTP